MDILTQLADVKDVELQTLLSHAMRNALQHNIYAANGTKAADENPQQAAQIAQAVAMHKETAMLVTELVNQVLKRIEEPKPPAAGKAKKK